MRECNSPRNSWRKLIQTMRLGAEPEPALPWILIKIEHRIDRFAHALKNSNQLSFSATSGGAEVSNVGPIGNWVQQRLAQSWIGKYASPFGKQQVGRHDNRRTFSPLRDYMKQELGANTTSPGAISLYFWEA
jgi:hypothetical protein